MVIAIHQAMGVFVIMSDCLILEANLLRITAVILMISLSPCAINASLEHSAMR